MLRILLLGTPVVTLDDVLYKITRRLQRAMLFYLAARGGPIGREELVGLFWPDADDEAAHRHLREALAKLRAELPDRSLLIVNSHQVSLDFKQVYVDVLEFRKMLRQVGAVAWQLPSHMPLPESIARLLASAMQLWRSPHFMAGSDLPDNLELENWHSLTSQELEQQRQRLVTRLAEHAFARGDLETTLTWLLLAVQNDETNEELNGRILSLLIDLGRRTAAVNFFNHLKELYQQDDGSPLPQSILTIYRRIQSPEEVSDLPGWPVTQRIHLPLVGRNAILNGLGQAYNRGGVVIIQGEAGAGKTRIAQELFQSLQPTPRLLLASAHPYEANLPFQAIIEMLRRYLTAAEWQKLSPVWGQLLASLLPELHLICPDFEIPFPLQPEQARPLLFEAVRQLLAQVAIKKRLFIFLDDAQWADEASLATLAYLLERGFFNRNGLLVIAARFEDSNPNLENTLEIARRSAQYQEICLPLLAKPEINELAGYALGQPPSDALLDRLAKDTGGNPLFILLTINALLEMRASPDYFQASDVLPLASGMHTLLRRRLLRVHPQTRQTALTAAVIGNTFEINVLENAVQLGEDSLAQALDELEKLQLIRVVHTPPGSHVTYTFVHDKIREVLLLELSLARSRLLHRRIAQALENSLGGRVIEQAAVLAQHYESAGDLIPAFDWWLKAAQRANQLLSIKEAEAAFKRAELILQHQTRELNDERVYQLYSQWGEMIYESHGGEPIEHIYSTLLYLGEQRQSPLLIGTGLSGLCAVVLNAKDLEKGLGFAEQALPYLERAGSNLELARLNNRLGMAYIAKDLYPEAIAAFEKAIELTSDCQQPAGQQAHATAQHEISWILFITGWPERAIQYADKALKERRFFLHYYNQMRFHNALILPNVYTGNYPLAHENSIKGIDLAHKLQNWRFLNYLQVFASSNELALGSLDRCMDYLTNAAELEQQYHIGVTAPDACESAGSIYQMLGAYEKAIEWYQRGLVAAEGTNDVAGVLHRLGLCLALSGQVESGLVKVKEAIAVSEAHSLVYISIPAHMSLAMLYLDTGEKEKARQEAEFVIAESRLRGFYAWPLIAGLVLGHIALEAGDMATARQYAQKAIEQPKQPANLFIEMQGLILNLRVLRLEQQENAQFLQRLIQRLDEIEANAQHPEIAPYFKTYRENLLATVR